MANDKAITAIVTAARRKSSATAVASPRAAEAIAANTSPSRASATRANPPMASVTTLDAASGPRCPLKDSVRTVAAMRCGAMLSKGVPFVYMRERMGSPVRGHPCWRRGARTFFSAVTVGSGRPPRPM